jgi:hypothetical protein
MRALLQGGVCRCCASTTLASARQSSVFIADSIPTISNFNLLAPHYSMFHERKAP